MMKRKNLLQRLMSYSTYIFAVLAIIIFVSIVYHSNENLDYNKISPIRYLFLVFYFGYGLYTEKVFTNDFSYSLMFGVTRKDYYQKYLKNIILVFALIIGMILAFYLAILFNELISHKEINIFSLIKQDNLIFLLCFIPFICGISTLITLSKQNKFSVAKIIVISVISIIGMLLTFIEMELAILIIISLSLMVIGTILLFIAKNIIMKRVI